MTSNNPAPFISSVAATPELHYKIIIGISYKKCISPVYATEHYGRKEMQLMEVIATREDSIFLDYIDTLCIRAQNVQHLLVHATRIKTISKVNYA